MEEEILKQILWASALIVGHILTFLVGMLVGSKFLKD